MRPLLFGLETEYALCARGEGRKGRVEQALALELLFRLVRRKLPHLCDVHGSGVFLANGSRLYVDAGDHPELSTPECADPGDVVRWALAGERILGDLAREIETTSPGLSLSLYRCNVDYSGTGQTWGCHESYLHRAHPEVLAQHLVPHLVSRLVYTGAGGFDNRSRQPGFLLSPRVVHLQQAVSPSSTERRGIFHTKDEPLCGGGFHRLHVICGESLSSQLAAWLRIATTSLLVRLVEAGVSTGAAMQLRRPVHAMRAFAASPSCSARALLESGGRVSALEIQRRLLESVEAQLGAPFLPSWAAAACRRWRDILDRLALGAEAVETRLDWAIKRSLFERRARARGDADLARATPAVLRELCELDTRFGEVGGRGIFDALDTAGVLDHRLDGLGPLDEAVRQAPSGGRAEVRGRAIRELFAQRDRYRADWQAIWDVQAPRHLDLSDPFVREASWKDTGTPLRARSRRSPASATLERLLARERQLPLPDLEPSERPPDAD